MQLLLFLSALLTGLTGAFAADRRAEPRQAELRAAETIMAVAIVAVAPKAVVARTVPPLPTLRAVAYAIAPLTTYAGALPARSEKRLL